MRKDDILALHGIEAYGRDPVDADDLVRLAGAWPELTPVFEEIQHLRRLADAEPQPVLVGAMGAQW